VYCSYITSRKGVKKMPTQEEINEAKEQLEKLSFRWASAMMQGDQILADRIESDMDELLEFIGVDK
jgi:hypothetical protein